jgi:short-subunit dehydrogenase
LSAITHDGTFRRHTSSTSCRSLFRLTEQNALSPMRVVEALHDLVVPGGTIGVMSSGQGSVANNENGNYEVYRGSKAALNMFMRSFAARLSIDESIPNLVGTIDAYAGRAGLHYLDYLGRVVPW